MLFPNDIQAALLFDGRIAALDGIVRTFLRIEQMQSGVRFNVPEAKPGVFYRLFGGDEMMITLEYIDRPADVAVFQQPLGSTATGILCPDIRERIMLSKSHILINVSHGVLGNSPEIARLMQTIGRAAEGASLPQFRRRLEVCALIARIACDEAKVSVVHWTQSNQLFPGDTFDALAAIPAPSPLHIHPWLFGGGKDAEGKTKVGIRTFGARHFIGRELLIEPSALPWAANYETMLAFLRVATTKKGYVIPDGDTFGPEDRSLSYRVIHREAAANDVPLYELEPLMHREYGFVAAEYVPPERVFDNRAPPPDLMPPEDGDKSMLVSEWRGKRALAEGIGGRFEVRARAGEPGVPPPPPAPLRPPAGPRGVFGRKGLG